MDFKNFRNAGYWVGRLARTMTVYLDHNAAAPLAASAAAAMREAMAFQANPSSVHGPGRAARDIVEQARRAVAASVAGRPQDVVFTGSGTEACRLMLNLPGRTRILASAVEHTAVLAQSPDVERLSVDRAGIIDLAALEKALAAGPEGAVVAVMLANNETGVIQPIDAVARIVKAAGARLAVDAAQAYGKIPVDLDALGADAIALSAAKIGGPLGAGAAVFRSGVTPEALLSGGGQERGLRAGSENITALAGFGAAASEIDARIVGQGGVAKLRDRLEAALPESARVIGPETPRLANTASIAMSGVEASLQVMALDLEGYAVSAGAACSSGKVARSHVLEAMGLARDVASGTIRVSLGLETTAEEIDGFAEAWSALYRRMVTSSEAGARP